jgi:glutamate synthase (NADPH/NADH) small chain
VRETAEGKPVQIGLLQRYATDTAMAAGRQFYERAKPTGKHVAVIGAGPAGLACAHRLARHGHRVTVYEAKKKPGGLNEFGIAAYKTVNGFAQAEVDYVAAIGGIEIRYGQQLGGKLKLAQLMADHDAVFIGTGLAGVNALGLKGAEPEGVEDAIDFIARLRQAKDKSKLPVGRRVVVIGGGMTAIDAAIQSKLLGAEEVTICYRRGPEAMKASVYEQELATSKGVAIRHWLQPKKMKASNGKLTGIEFEYAEMVRGKLTGTGKKLTLAADQVFRAIGQSFDNAGLFGANLRMSGGRIDVDAEGRTSVKGIWAGGDCVNRGEDLTVTGVAQGRDAAESIHRALMG